MNNTIAPRSNGYANNSNHANASTRRNGQSTAGNKAGSRADSKSDNRADNKSGNRVGNGAGDNVAKAGDDTGRDIAYHDDAQYPGGDATRTTATTGGDALAAMSDPLAPRLDASSVSVNDKRVVSFSFDRPGRGATDVTISNTGVTFTHTAPAMGSDKPASPKQTIKFSQMQDLTKQQRALLGELDKALAQVNPDELSAPQSAAFGLATGRMDSLKDPSLWSDVAERLDNLNVQTLADGRSSSILEEVPLESKLTGSGTSRRVEFEVRIDGKEETAERKGGGNSVKVDGKAYPLRYDDASGQWMVVTKHKIMTPEQAETRAIGAELNQRTAAAVVNTLPVERGPDGVQLSSLETVPESDGTISLSFAREGGAVERVRISDRGISFKTYMPSDLPGVTDKDGYNALSSGLRFQDIASWGEDAGQQVEDFRAMLDDVDTSQLDATQAGLLDTARARLDVLQQPAFWGAVNDAVATKVTAELPDVGPIIVDDGLDVIIDRDLGEHGETETKFFVLDDDGKRVEITPNADDTAVFDGKDYPIATDVRTGDLILVRKHRTADAFTQKVIGNQVNKRVEAQLNAEPAPIDSVPPTEPFPNAAVLPVGGPAPVDAPDVSNADAVRNAFVELLNDPALFESLLADALAEVTAA